MKKKKKNDSVPPPLIVKPRLCPEAILEWSNTTGKISRCDLTEKARAHLSALGWKFWYKNKSNNRMELRYESPTGKVFYSLRAACRACVEEEGLSQIVEHTTLKPKDALPVVDAGDLAVVLLPPPEKPKRSSRRKLDSIGEPVRNPKPKRGKVLADLKRVRDENERNRDVEMRSSDDENHDECSVCCYGGELVLCDGCPSAFHAGCIGLGEVGDGDWFCPSCCCGFCNLGILEDDGVASCDQCRQRYHIGCARNSGEAKLGVDGKLFCSRKCENVCLGINKILGKAIVVGPDNLTWTLLKSSSTCDVDNLTRNYRQHKLAVEVMHECFEPTQDPYTRSDVVDDVIFNRQKKFRGFYTAVLERNEEVISAATVRVYSELGEVPLVATKFKHRRLGMCRILMSELEKQLVKLGIGKLVLPSAKDALEAWTSTSLGFSKMTADETLPLLKYRFWNFQDTTMCHKVLKKQTTSTESDGSAGAISTVTQVGDIDASEEACIMDIDYDYDFMLEDDSKFLSWYKSGSKKIVAL
ncbi:putative histone acetyltransferase chromatin regulator PHD family [Rosa chinensis]|uniref:Putative histone acetyltransferase chromatin regulator PHD family n=1 Tax=Rosa chinensis TaxID=74649 RepID=A0A2P6Q0W7_ROSCH|nr:putative histone acetyltransferase chromatin regulator PHD family [Rosa chinensis]